MLVSFEDRAFNNVALKLLALSLAKHQPDARLHLYQRQIDRSLQEWMKRHAAGVSVHQIHVEKGVGWNVKPQILIRALSELSGEVVWIDTDIILAGPLPDFGSLSPRDLVYAEERGTYDPRRATFWGLTPSPPPTSINSCYLRVTRAHRPLLDKWEQLTKEPDFLRAQELSHGDRPAHLNSDQDLLAGLLGSTLRGELGVSDLIPARIGQHILHNIAITVRSRIRPLPPLIHALGVKPWMLPVRGRADWKAVRLELSPYAAVAETYLAHPGLVDENLRLWVRPVTLTGRFCNFVSCGHPVHRSTPLYIGEALIKRLGRLRK